MSANSLFKICFKQFYNFNCLSFFVRHFSSSVSSTVTNNYKLYEWKEPDGYDTGIKVINAYRSLGKLQDAKKVPLIVRDPKCVAWYSCGPTVYDKPHIGHASSYIRFDTIRRILTNHFGLNIIYVIGITDIDDKIINRATLHGKDFLSMAASYEEEFKVALRSLNIDSPSMYVRVSDVIPQIIKFVNRLLDTGHAYRTDNGNVWFDLNRFTDKGRLSYIAKDWDGSESSKISFGKRNQKDFALWKAAKPGEPYWETPWGMGRPGWHVECSTIGTMLFGNKLDIHTGAKDLCLHHECELFQSEAYHSCEQWVNYFFHSGHLVPSGSSAKMSKSLGNVINVDNFVMKYSADVLRLLCLSNNWNSNITYKQIYLTEVEQKIRAYQTFLTKCKQYVVGNISGDVSNPELLELLEKSKNEVHSALCDNFDTENVLAVVDNLCDKVDSMLSSGSDFSVHSCDQLPRDTNSIMLVYDYVCSLFKMLGFTSLNAHGTVVETDHLQNNAGHYNSLLSDLQDFRNIIRTVAMNLKKNNLSNFSNDLFGASDEMRAKVNLKGNVIKDTKL